MATAVSIPGPTNVFIPNWEASGKLLVGFARNPRTFPINRYIARVKSPKVRGYYLKYTNQAAGRVIDSNRYLWPDGMTRPVPKTPESFIYIQFNCVRRDYGYGLGQLTIDMADHNVAEVERKGKAALMMTARSLRVHSVLNTTTNWGTAADPDLSTNHQDTATNMGGGKFDVGTSTAPYLQKGLNKAASIITLDTMGAVANDPTKFYVIMNPDDARLIASSPEIHDYLKGSPSAYAEVTGGLHPNNKYGLPQTLYGYEIVVDDTVKVTSEEGATLGRSYSWTAAQVAMVTREGELEGVYGERSFSTFTVFWQEDMTVEEYADARNRLWEGHVAENTAEVLTCPASGFLFTACTG
jgi:hypothetical protein